MKGYAYVTYDSNVLGADGPFAGFMGDRSASAFVIEDADTFLKSRAEGNEMVSRFLNVGDGLIKLRDKKLIFSTNLPNLRDIDAALVRPGRCFDIVKFRKLTKAEALIICEKRGLKLYTDQAEYSLAEIFNPPVNNIETKFGF
jgi:SpoVK/Ycf46/Vps4 family AAA+-type ATPase